MTWKRIVVATVLTALLLPVAASESQSRGNRRNQDRGGYENRGNYNGGGYSKGRSYGRYSKGYRSKRYSRGYSSRKQRGGYYGRKSYRGGRSWGHKRGYRGHKRGHWGHKRGYRKSNYRYGYRY